MEDPYKAETIVEFYRRRLSAAVDGETNKTAEITFQIVFYGLFMAMLIAFWFVFKRGQKTN
jgi:hypothetical protein